MAVVSADIPGYSFFESLGKQLKSKKAPSPSFIHPSDGPAISSYHPLLPNIRGVTDDETTEGRSTLESPWLLCHYFEYIVGTRTGG